MTQAGSLPSFFVNVPNPVPNPVPRFPCFQTLELISRETKSIQTDRTNVTKREIVCSKNLLLILLIGQAFYKRI